MAMFAGSSSCSMAFDSLSWHLSQKRCWLDKDAGHAAHDLAGYLASFYGFLGYLGMVRGS